MSSRLAYDDANGQVYAETIATVQSMMATWVYNSKGKKERPSSYRNSGPGTAALYDAALRSCLWNSDLLTTDALVYAPWPCALKIYKSLTNSNTLTFKTWVVFEEAFPEATELDHEYRTHIIAKRGAFPHEIESIQRQLVSLPFASLSYLDMRNLRLDYTHLMALTHLQNLAVLVLEQDSSLVRNQDDNGITDQFLRRWSIAIQQQKAFSKLRVLVFRHFQTSIEGTLACLYMFPILILCSINTSHANHDTNSGPNGEPSPSKGPWLHLATEANEQKRGQDPQSIWQRTDKTTHEKMKTLYAFAGTLRSTEGQKVESSTAVVSILYGDASRYTDRQSHPTWYVRQYPSENEVMQPLEHPSDIRTAFGGSIDANKRRKVRHGKQKDIGGLLGSFM